MPLTFLLQFQKSSAEYKEMAQCVSSGVSAAVLAPAATSGRRFVARASVVNPLPRSLSVARKLAKGASYSVSQGPARRAGVFRRQAVVKAAVGTGKGGLEMVTLKDGDDYAEVCHCPIIIFFH